MASWILGRLNAARALDPEAFDTFYRRYVETCIAAGVELRTREYTAGLIASWELVLTTPVHALAPACGDGQTAH